MPHARQQRRKQRARLMPRSTNPLLIQRPIPNQTLLRAMVMERCLKRARRRQRSSQQSLKTLMTLRQRLTPQQRMLINPSTTRTAPT